MERGNEYFKKAKQYQFDDDLKNAVYYYNLAVEYGSTDAYLELGIIYLDEGENEKAVSYLEKALDYGNVDACEELIRLFSKEKNYKKCLLYFFKCKHNPKECYEIIKIIDAYSKELEANINPTSFDVFKEFETITNWLNKDWCSFELRKRLLIFREKVLEMCLPKTIQGANSIVDIKKLSKMIGKCKNLSNDQEILLQLNKKIIELELSEQGINKYSEIFKKTKNKPYFDEIVTYVVNSFLTGENGVPKDITKAIEIANKELSNTLNVSRFYQKAIDLIDDEFVRKSEYDQALTLLELIPGKYSDIEKNIVKRKQELTRIAELEALPDTEIDKKVELANLYLNSRNPDYGKGVKLLEFLYYKHDNEKALSLLLDYKFKNEDINRFYQLCEDAINKNLRIDPIYFNYYKEFKDKIDKWIEEKNKIKEEVQRRGIKYLVHFTDRSNLDSILRYGLLSRRKQSEFNLKVNCTDEKNRGTYGISTTITKPNGYMLRDKIRNKIISSPAIIYIDASILYNLDFDIVFYQTNSANTNMEYLAGREYQHFLNMFRDYVRIKLSDGTERPMISRIDENRSNNETTDEQAEALVMNEIPVKYIKEVRSYFGSLICKVVNGKIER